MQQRTQQFAALRQALCIAAGLLALATAHAAGAGESAAFGFSPAQGARQQALEQRFDASSTRRICAPAAAPVLRSEPRRLAPRQGERRIRSRPVQAVGWDAQIEVFEVLYPTLRAHSLELWLPRSSPQACASRDRGRRELDAQRRAAALQRVRRGRAM